MEREPHQGNMLYSSTLRCLLGQLRARHAEYDTRHTTANLYLSSRSPPHNPNLRLLLLANSSERRLDAGNCFALGLQCVADQVARLSTVLCNPCLSLTGRVAEIM